MKAQKTNKNSSQTSQKITDNEKRNFIVKVQDIGLNTAAELSGKNLESAYKKALRDVELVALLKMFLLITQVLLNFPQKYEIIWDMLKAVVK